jgi:hypothetical protein
MRRVAAHEILVVRFGEVKIAIASRTPFSLLFTRSPPAEAHF